MSGSNQTVVTAVPENAIVHEFDELGRIIGDGERRLATLLGKVMAALGSMHPHASADEIHSVVDDTKEKHEAEAADTDRLGVPYGTGDGQAAAQFPPNHYDPNAQQRPLGGLRGVDETGHYSVGNARAEQQVPAAHPGSWRPGDPQRDPVPELGAIGTVETVNYTDGTSATGLAPMPRLSPGQQATEATRLEAAYNLTPAEAERRRVQDQARGYRGEQQSGGAINTPQAPVPVPVEQWENAHPLPAEQQANAAVRLGLPPTATQAEVDAAEAERQREGALDPAERGRLASPGEQHAAAVSQEATDEARNEARVRQIEEDERARQRGDNVTDPGNATLGGGAIHY